MDEAEKVLERVDSMHLEFAKRAAVRYSKIFLWKKKSAFFFFFQPFNNWLDGTREDLVDMFIVHTLDEIQGLIDAHAQFKATLGEADKEFQAIIALIHEVEGFAKQYNVPGANINPYTNLTGAVSKFFFSWRYLLFDGIFALKLGSNFKIISVDIKDNLSSSICE